MYLIKDFEGSVMIDGDSLTMCFETLSCQVLNTNTTLHNLFIGNNQGGTTNVNSFQCPGDECSDAKNHLEDSLNFAPGTGILVAAIGLTTESQSSVWNALRIIGPNLDLKSFSNCGGNCVEYVYAAVSSILQNYEGSYGQALNDSYVEKTAGPVYVSYSTQEKVAVGSVPCECPDTGFSLSIPFPQNIRNTVSINFDDTSTGYYYNLSSAVNDESASGTLCKSCFNPVAAALQ